MNADCELYRFKDGDIPIKRVTLAEIDRQAGKRLRIIKLTWFAYGMLAAAVPIIVILCL